MGDGRDHGRDGVRAPLSMKTHERKEREMLVSRGTRIGRRVLTGFRDDGTTRLRDDGTVCLPPCVGDEWRLGQRVYVHVWPGRLLIAARLKRTANGHVHATRLRRGQWCLPSRVADRSSLPNHAAWQRGSGAHRPALVELESTQQGGDHGWL